MYTKSDEQRRKQIFSGFIQKGCSGIYGVEKEQPAEEKSPAEQEKEKKQNKK